jgi:hypothetical protein
MWLKSAEAKTQVAWVFNQPIQGRKCEDFPTSRKQDLAHVLTPRTKTPTIDACNQLDCCA